MPLSDLPHHLFKKNISVATSVFIDRVMAWSNRKVKYRYKLGFILLIIVALTIPECKNSSLDVADRIDLLFVMALIKFLGKLRQSWWHQSCANLKTLKTGLFKWRRILEI